MMKATVAVLLIAALACAGGVSAQRVARPMNPGVPASDYVASDQYTYLYLLTSFTEGHDVVFSLTATDSGDPDM